jgi:transcription initiation factor TFIID subunit 11
LLPVDLVPPEVGENFLFADGFSFSRVLVDAFNPVQSARYDLFKRTKLKKETLRRIVNHALSQSVPASVVTTVNGFTKLFVGEIIEKARTVQAEWAMAYDQAARAAFEAEETAAQEAEAAAELSIPTKTSDTLPIVDNSVKDESSNGAGVALDISSVLPHISSSPTLFLPGDYCQSPYSQTTAALPEQSQLQHASMATNDNATDIPQGSAPPRREFNPPPNPHRGQLLPSHLREALRRYKQGGEGGGVGTSTLSQQHFGVKGTFTWGIGIGGQRLFR